MHELRRIGVIYNVDGDRLSFPHAQHWAGRGVVITDGREDVGAVEFDGNGRNAKCMIGFGVGRRPVRRTVLSGKRQSRHYGLRQDHAAELEEVAPLHNRRSRAGWTFLHGLTVKVAGQAWVEYG
jgi:hypothetical protein